MILSPDIFDQEVERVLAELDANRDNRIGKVAKTVNQRIMQYAFSKASGRSDYGEYDVRIFHEDLEPLVEGDLAILIKQVEDAGWIVNYVHFIGSLELRRPKQGKSWIQKLFWIS